MAPSIPQFITYEWSCDDKSKQFDVHNPATGAKLTTIQAGDAGTVDKAVRVAKEAFKSWSQLAPVVRSQYMFKCAEALEAKADELAELLCLENGKPAQDARAFDLNFVAGVYRFFASLVDKLPTQFYDRGSVYTTVVREPLGVVAGILPFNWPPIHTGGKSAPAIAVGNCIILKPGEQAPLTCMRLVEILQSVLPRGVVQAVPGVGSDVPAALVEHEDVKMVSFTGSTAAGKAVNKSAAPMLKHIALELGGKNAFLVFDDANLERAAKDAVEGAFFNKGEACTASSRLLVHESIYDKFVGMVGAMVKGLRAGDGLKEDTHVGPCVTKAQQDRVLKYIQIGKEEGAVVAAEGEIPSDPAYKDGYFVKPTVFKNVKREMTIAVDEIFGPVVVAIPFSTEDEAVSIANESSYGLVSLVYTQDSERGLRVSRRLETGMVWMNNYRRNILGIPFGGVKDSGHAREHCIDTLNEWTTAKFIQMPSGRGELGQWRGIDDLFQQQVNGVNGA